MHEDEVMGVSLSASLAAEEAAEQAVLAQLRNRAACLENDLLRQALDGLAPNSKVPCCNVPHFALLYHAVLCCAVLCGAVLCCRCPACFEATGPFLPMLTYVQVLMAGVYAVAINTHYDVTAHWNHSSSTTQLVQVHMCLKIGNTEQTCPLECWE